ncbi:uncharacterized protein LOC115442265 [Manduca sexta]|uniref:Uncharacterized protein n=1 Tax=Manduca sexta TaxID=7130 RepID=A0A922CJA0_MANSE|nr:uncharacterized protein LOC115442265 [Manduca sexta]KAG6448207.1 hypothetical protein O3G_MSEX005366 [Manduca sexta]
MDLVQLFLFILLIQYGVGETTGENDTKSLIESYENNLNTSIALGKNDRVLVDTWTVEFQVKRVNITTKYRLQMTRHKEHNFKPADYNLKWGGCVDLHRKEIRRSERNYYNHETDCLKSVSALDSDKRRSVDQVEKEIRKWRKSYRYLVNLCDINNLNDKEGAQNCLVEYMERDKFSQVIERLVIIKLEVMGDLYLHYTTSLTNLDECLKKQLSRYLDRVRAIMDVLNKCYDL